MSDYGSTTHTSDVIVSGLINAPITQVWATVGEFNAFPTILPQIWDASTVEGRGVGAVRILSNNAGADIIEQLEQIDSQGSVRSVSFSILGGSFADLLPVDFKTYETSIQLQDAGSQTLFTWSANYDVKAGISEDEAKAVFEGIFNSALDGLRTIHTRQSIDCETPDIDLSPIENPDATVSVVIDAPADAVWATIGNFDALPHYLPALWNDSVVVGDGVGAVRTLTNAEGAEIVEELVGYDGVGAVRSLQFSILESTNFPLPFDTSTYLASMQVEDLGNHQARFTWSARYEPLEGIAPEDAKATLEGLFGVAVTNLKLIHEQPDPYLGEGGEGCSLETGDRFYSGIPTHTNPKASPLFSPNGSLDGVHHYPPIDSCYPVEIPFTMGSTNSCTHSSDRVLYESVDLYTPPVDLACFAPGKSAVLSV